VLLLDKRPRVRGSRSVSVRRVELDDVVRKRRMTRRYSGEPVPAEVLDRVLGVAMRAPSAGFSQGVDLLVLEGPAQTGQFFEMTSDPEFLAGSRARRGHHFASVRQKLGFRKEESIHPG